MSQKKGPSDIAKSVRRRKVLAWTIVQVLIPYVFVVGCWPLAAFGKIHYAFYKTFFGADLVLLGVVLFIAIVVEIHIEQARRGKSQDRAALDFYWFFTLLFLIVFLGVFVALKRESIGYDFPSVAPNAPPQQVSSTITDCVKISLVAGGFAFLWSLVAGIHVNALYLEAEVASRRGNSR
jgi:hypothetical protein